MRLTLVGNKQATWRQHPGEQACSAEAGEHVSASPCACFYVFPTFAPAAAHRWGSIPVCAPPPVPPSRRLHDSAYMCQLLEENYKSSSENRMFMFRCHLGKKKKKKACFCSRRSPSIIKLMAKEALLRPLINFSPYEYQVSCFYNRQLT